MEPEGKVDPLPDAALLMGLVLPAECVAGVRVALEGLAEHLRVIEGFYDPADGA